MLHGSYDVLFQANLTVTFSFQLHENLMPRWWIRHLQYSHLYYIWKSFEMPTGMHEWWRSTPALIFLKNMNFLWPLQGVVNQFTAKAQSFFFADVVMYLSQMPRCCIHQRFSLKHRPISLDLWSLTVAVVFSLFCPWTIYRGAADTASPWVFHHDFRHFLQWKCPIITSFFLQHYCVCLISLWVILN